MDGGFTCFFSYFLSILRRADGELLPGDSSRIGRHTGVEGETISPSNDVGFLRLIDGRVHRVDSIIPPFQREGIDLSLLEREKCLFKEIVCCST